MQHLLTEVDSINQLQDKGRFILILGYELTGMLIIENQTVTVNCSTCAAIKGCSYTLIWVYVNVLITDLKGALSAIIVNFCYP